MAEQIASTIRNAIIKGTYRPGDALPGERELAEQFQVNRSSIREALQRLDAWGLVEVRQGGATRVGELVGKAGVHLLPYLIAPEGEVDPKLLLELLELRVVLMGWTAAQAAKRASPEALARLKAVLLQLDSAKNLEEVQAYDYVFYEALVAATGNRVLAIISDAVSNIYLHNKALFISLYPALPLDTGLHHQALAAIEAHEPQKAKAAMEAYAARVLGGLDD
jgi:DNA-binding FadR family transcriptional regulator